MEHMLSFFFFSPQNPFEKEEYMMNSDSEKRLENSKIYFYILVIVNNAAMNIRIQKTLQDLDFITVG